MAWSTRQLADIAKTTVNTVRHYHKVGLLPLPERAANGYKRYGIAHLVRLLRIRRLSELGMPLAQISELERGETDMLDQLRNLDTELEADIERLTRLREEVAVILYHAAPIESPAEFAALSPGFSPTQRSLLAIYSTIFDEATLNSFRQVLSLREETDVEFDRLPPDTAAAAIEDLARRMVPVTRRVNREHPLLENPLERSPLGAKAAGLIMGHALVELYNPAQLQVLRRLDELMSADDDASP